MLPLMDGRRPLNEPGVTVTPLGNLGSIRAAQLPPRGGMVTIERVLLAPGTSLPPRAATGPTLLAVEAGMVGLVPVRETAWLHSGSGRDTAASAGSEAILTAGTTAFWNAGAVALLRGGQDSAGSALLLTLSPAHEGGKETS